MYLAKQQKMDQVLRRLEEAPGFFPQPGSALTNVVIWGVSQRMEELFLCNSGLKYLK